MFMENDVSLKSLQMSFPWQAIKWDAEVLVLRLHWNNPTWMNICVPAVNLLLSKSQDRLDNSLVMVGGGMYLNLAEK